MPSLYLFHFPCLYQLPNSKSGWWKSGRFRLYRGKREIPGRLKTKIEENKTTAFKITYKDGEDLYIAVGYGERPTGGYSIAVNDLYLGENAIHITTTLIGPSKDETVTQVLTYPYIVVKTAFREEPVVFH